VQYWDPDKAEGFYHALGGWLIFVVALLMLFAVHRLISLIGKNDPVASRDLALRDLALRDLEPRDLEPMEQPTAGNHSMKFGPLRFGIVAVPMLATAIGLQAHSRTEYFPPRESLSSLPSQIDGWKGTDEPLDQATLDILGPGEFLVRDYENTTQESQPQSLTPQSQPPQSQPWINLYIAYFPTQKAGDTIHSPQHCLPGAGWVPTSRAVVQVVRPDGSSFPANRYVVSNAEEKRLVLYWFQAHGREVASEYWAKYYLVSDSVRMNRSDGALVRLMTPLLDDESPDAAETRLMKLGSQFLPLFDSYIPR
jgi:EpsI family protein